MVPSFRWFLQGACCQAPQATCGQYFVECRAHCLVVLLALGHHARHIHLAARLRLGAASQFDVASRARLLRVYELQDPENRRCRDESRSQKAVMKVRELMTAAPTTYTPDTMFAAVAHLMWEGDCGILPVVDDGELVGVVTDRDMYIALATRNAQASAVRVGAVATRNVATCKPDDEVETALATMKRARVRRLPVVNADGTLLGVLSINDILLAAGANKPVRNEDVVDTLQAICRHRDQAPQVAAA